MWCLFERAVFRAGWYAALASIPFYENRFVRGPLARQRGRGWTEVTDHPLSTYSWERIGGVTSAEYGRGAA